MRNHADAGTYATAIRKAALSGTAPSVISTRRSGTLKYGFGANVEQELTKDIGVFARARLERRENGKLCIHRDR